MGDEGQLPSRQPFVRRDGPTPENDILLSNHQDPNKPDEILDQAQEPREDAVEQPVAPPEADTELAQADDSENTVTAPNDEDVPNIDWSQIPFPPIEDEGPVLPSTPRKKWSTSTVNTPLVSPSRSPFSLSSNSPNRIHGGSPPRKKLENFEVSPDLVLKLGKLRLSSKPKIFKSLRLACFKLPVELWFCIFDYVSPLTIDDFRTSSG